MGIKVNQFSIKSRINDDNSKETFGGNRIDSGNNKIDDEFQNELIQKCVEKVLDHLKGEKERF
tara:strand:+ start:1384 stop:1572 length:189 start_codon:yes stop_codon:yes gene_type:complete